MTASSSREPVRTRRERVARFLFALLDLPVLAVVVIGLAATVLHPRLFWWAQLVAIGLPYAAWGLLAMTGLALLLRWKGVVIVHALVLGLVLLRVGVPSRAASPTPGAEDLRLMTFNLPLAGPSRESLGDSAAAFVRNTEPDLLLLQDTWVNPGKADFNEAVHVKAVLDRLPYELTIPARIDSIAGRDRAEMGVPMLVRQGGVTTLAQENIIPTGGPNVSIALRSHLRWKDREFVLYNLHLRSFGPTKPWEDPEVRWNRPSSWTPYLQRYRRIYAQRSAEADLIAGRIEDESLPVIVAGDFNSTADNWSTRRIRNAGRRRADAFHVGAGLRWGRTYHAARPLVRIDFVLVDPAFEVTSARVLDVGFSDHRPVLTRLRWAPAE